MDSQRERPGFDYVASFIGQGQYNDCPIIFNGKETPTHGWIDDVSTDYAIKFLKMQTRTSPSSCGSASKARTARAAARICPNAPGAV